MAKKKKQAARRPAKRSTSKPAKSGHGGARPGAGRKPANGHLIKRGIRVSDSSWHTWKAAAARSGKTLNEWIRDACDAVAAAAAEWDAAGDEAASDEEGRSPDK